MSLRSHVPSPIAARALALVLLPLLAGNCLCEQPSPPELPTEAPVTTPPSLFGVSPGMSQDQCMDVARDRHQIGETEDGIVAVDGTFADQPVQMRWNFHDGRLVLVDATFPGYTTLEPLSETPMYVEIAAFLGEPAETGSEGRKTFAHWSAGDVRVRLMSHSRAVKGRGEIAEYTAQVFSASHYGAP